jgi:hypothetical protein
MSEKAVAGIPLEDGGELVLGPEEKVSSDDHKAAAQRFAHMKKDGQALRQQRSRSRSAAHPAT